MKVCEPAAPAGITLDEVTVRYGAHIAIERASFAVRPGELMALVGPSGCGKTSLLNAINRLSDLIPGCTVTGRIAVGGRDVRAPDTRLTALRRKVGMVFQQPNPFPLSTADNLGFPLREHGVLNRDERERRTEEALRAGPVKELRSTTPCVVRMVVLTYVSDIVTGRIQPILTSTDGAAKAALSIWRVALGSPIVGNTAPKLHCAMCGS